jgi:hypothetical protein
MHFRLLCNFMFEIPFTLINVWRVKTPDTGKKYSGIEVLTAVVMKTTIL